MPGRVIISHRGGNVFRRWFFLLPAAALLASGCGRREAPGELRGTITFSGAWALSPLVYRWSEEFRKAHPGVRFQISMGGAGKGMEDTLAGRVDLGMVSREVSPGERELGAWAVPVARTAVVAVMNRDNPAAEAVRERGMTRQELAALWLRGEVKSWPASPRGVLVPELTVYTRSDDCGAAEVWARWLGGEPGDLLGEQAYGDPGLARAVRRDFGGVGYLNLNYAYDPATGRPAGGLLVIPIDLDGSGRIEEEEDFYGDLHLAAAAVADGRYPSPPARDLYLVARGRPQREEVLAFLRWVLDGGQEMVEAAGYAPLDPRRLRSARTGLE